MTIITKNSNPKNDSAYARHRSIWNGRTNVLDGVITNLKGAAVKYKRYLGTPQELRDMWYADFGKVLPHWKVDPEQFPGQSGVVDWLGAKSPFTGDVQVIWKDFVKIFGHRSDPEGKTKELLFMSRSQQYFDLIYSKWGYSTGKHWFFHWTSEVAAQRVNRATIDVGNDDEDGEGVDTD